MKLEREVLSSLEELILERYSDQLDTLSFPPEDPSVIRKELAQYDFAQPKSLKEVVSETIEMLKKWNLNTSHPRYLGLFNGPAHFSSVVADAITASYNPQLSTWSHGAAAIEIESHVIQFFLKEFGLDCQNGSGHFTSGGSESNTTALLCALNSTFPDFKKQGLIMLKQRPILYVSEYCHHSVQKAACSVGLGMESIRIVPVDQRLGLDAECLKAMLDLDLRDEAVFPMCVVGTAGTTSAGVIDPLDKIAEICKQRKLWFHVDAAWGGAAVMSERLKPYLNGIEKADSVTFDAHKWMAVSMGAGIFLCNHKKVVEDTFRIHADYMPEFQPGTMDLHKTSLQWSRRFIGLKVFFALAEMGRIGFQKQIDHQTEIGNFLRSRLVEKGWVLVNSTPLPVICFTHPEVRKGRISIRDILKSLYATQRHWISETKIQGEIVLRACITHPETSQEDIQILIDGLVEIICRHLQP